MCSYLNTVVALFDKISEQSEQIKQILHEADKNPSMAQEHSSDFDKLKSAFNDFQALREVEKNGLISAINDNAVDEKEVSRMRHDLRAKIGAVQGYSQLILEEIEYANVPNEALSQTCNKLATLAANIIPVIGSIQIENNEAPNQVADNLETGDDTYHDLMEHADQTVLIVDDSEYNRDLLQRRLVRTNINVLTAVNGQDGLDVVAKNKVDLILLDIMMPVLDGYETLKRLKSNTATANIPVLMISAIDKLESVIKCIEIGAEDYLSTPFNPIMLHARVKTCLEKKRSIDKEDEYMQAVINARQTLSAAIESIDDGFAIFDENGHLTMCNEKFADLYPSVAALGGTGFSYEDFIHKNIELNTYLVDRRSKDKDGHDSDLGAMKIAKFKSLVPYMEQLSDGAWLEICCHPMPGGSFVSLHKDVTQRHRDEQRLTFLALHDPLTGLANRASFERYLEKARALYAEKSIKFGLLYLDLDGFKGINDNLGHEKGDEVLKTVSAKLQDSLRAGDLVARLGGDEFAMILSNVGQDEIIELAQRLINLISQDYDCKDKKLHVGASIGIAMYPEDGFDAEVFIAHADQAMYAAKKAGKGQYKLFSQL